MVKATSRHGDFCATRRDGALSLSIVLATAIG
jgi:hypothetical protein